ncbi:coiled-coil domain-containing protein 114 isoform X1 [Halichoeres trimaculatus]|uniref:coiled-coil domain-containing protein 114 isoform X1 n=2 Tax=Halichoeres trimaculatus TaxID=147232 RepID=UPI003D9DF8E9
MPRGKSIASARSDTSEIDIDGTESEMAKLQRQFKIMEGDRQAYSLQAREQMRKQEQEIEKLQKEQEELHRNLGLCKRVSRQQQDSEDAQSLRALLEQKDMLEEELKKEKDCQKELEKEISNMRLEIEGQRRSRVSASKKQRNEVQQTEKTIHTLEYRLDRALTRFNEQLTNNCHLREELQTLQIERARFQQLKNRLEKELCDIRKKIGEVVTHSTAAYDSRVEAQSKMTMMKEKTEKDLAQYNVEMKELERVIARECSLKEFMTTKCSEKRGQDDGHEAGHRQLSVLKEQRKMDSAEESLDTLEEVFEKIQNVTGEDNLDLLVTRFIQVEDRNFALFNFVNEQNSEAEVLRDQISQIQLQIEQFGETALQQEQEHDTLMRKLDEKQKEIDFQTEDYEQRASIISKILEQIKTEVDSIVSKIECDRSVIEDKLGFSAGISENNIMAYLGLVEQKANELLTMQAFLNSQDLGKDYSPKDLAKFLLGQNPEQLQQNITVQPAIDNLEYDETPITDEEERPLSPRELRRRIVKGVQQKDSSRQQAAIKAAKVSVSLPPLSPCV